MVDAISRFQAKCGTPQCLNFSVPARTTTIQPCIHIQLLMSKSPKLPFFEKVGYGLGDTASNFVWATMISFLALYYTDIFGISAGAMGALLLFARCADGFIDFGMGAIADRTKTKWGRFRPYLLWMCVPLAVVFILTFTVPPASWSAPMLTLPKINIFGWEIIPADSVVTSKLIYAWITYNLMMILYTAINIPYGALSGVMTDDPLDRTSLSSYRMALAQVGGLMVNGLTFPLMAYFGGPGGDRQTGYHGTVIVFSVMAVILFLITFFATRERIEPPPAQKSSLKADFATLFGNQPWVIMFICAILNMIFVIARAANTIYYFKYSMGIVGDVAKIGPYHLFGQAWTWDWISALLVMGSIPFIIGTTFTRSLVKVMGKKYGFIFTMALGGLSMLPFYWLTPGHIGPLVVLIFVGQIIGGINASLYWSMLGDIADFTEWKFKIRNTGIVFSATTCAQKIGMGVGGYLLGAILTHYHYVANEVQTPESIHGINLLMSFIPCAGSLLIAAIFCFYGLNEKFCHEMREELAQRRLERGQLPID